MANRFWVLGSGTWNTTTTTNWSTSSGGAGGASAPTAADTVVFDNNSNTGTGAFTVTVSGGLCLDMTFGTGASALDGAMTLAMGTSTLAVSGNWTNPATNFGYSGTGTITFNSTTSKTITTNGISMVSAITFNGVGGTWALQNALTTSVGQTVTLTNGTLNLNNFNLTCGSFSSTNTNTRTIAYGTGQIYVIALNVTVFNLGTTTGLTVTGAPVVNVTGSGTAGQTRILAIGTTGGSSAIATTVNVTAGADTVTIGGNNYVNNLTYSSFTGTASNISQNIYGNLTLSTGMTVGATTIAATFAATSGTKTITTNGVALDQPITFNGVGGTWALQDALTTGTTRTVTLTNGTLDLNSKNLTTGLFSSNNSNTRTLAFGTGQIYLTGSGATIWAGGTATNFTVTGTPIVNATYSGATGTRTINFGGLPEAQTISLNVTAGTDTVAFVTLARYRNIDFTGFSGSLNPSSYFVYGNYTASSGMTFNAGAFNVVFASTSGTKTITTAGKTWDFGVNFDGVGGTWAMQDALTLGATNGDLGFFNGTLQLKSGVTSTVKTFTTTGTTLKYLRSTSAGTQATLSQASGTVAATYLDIKDSNATGGATWDARAVTNVNNGNNTGWLFPSNGNFFLLFA